MRVQRSGYRLAGWIVVVGALALICGSAQATPYWGPDEVARWEAARAIAPAEAPAIQVPMDLFLDAAGGPRDEASDLEVLGRVAHFLSLWQVSDPLDPQFGGMREGEHLPDIIQTDNTSESIWVWSRYYELTGDNQYYQNILDAFTYSLTYPAYLEEGGSLPTSGYYRMYNCGWAVRAELKYRLTYGDDTYQAYGDACGAYIHDHTLNILGSGFSRDVNPPVLAWAAGNLYYAGAVQGIDAWREEAVRKGRDEVRVWVEANPALISKETWAMSGGAIMWGLLNSYFIADASQLESWIGTYAPTMDTYAAPAGDFTNAWNGWYALGHHAVGEALDDLYYTGVYHTLTDTLISEDGDEDGGVPARPEDSDTQDQTWVSNYLAFMGLSPRLAPAAGVPGIEGPEGPVAALGSGGSGLGLRCWPNPARGGLHLAFALPRAGEASVGLYDCAGRCVTTLTRGHGAAGERELHWTGRDAAGRPVTVGTYFVVIRSLQGEEARRIQWLR